MWATWLRPTPSRPGYCPCEDGAMSTLALIGSGEMGGMVARLAVATGLDVVLSNSRGRDGEVVLIVASASDGPEVRAL